MCLFVDAIGQRRSMSRDLDTEDEAERTPVDIICMLSPDRP